MEVETAYWVVASRVGTRVEKAGRRKEDHAVLQVGEEMPSLTPETAAIEPHRGDDAANGFGAPICAPVRFDAQSLSASGGEAMRWFVLLIAILVLTMLMV